MSTPCEKKGYEEGQVFEYTGTANGNSRGTSTFDVGDILVLEEGDHDSAPPFFVARGKEQGKTNTASIHNVKRIYPPEEESKDITMVCKETGKETILSRESAKTQNFV